MMMNPETHVLTDTQDKPNNIQAALLADEAIATWTARNRIREALSTQIMRMISEGKDASKLIDQLNTLTALDSFTEGILSKLM